MVEDGGLRMEGKTPRRGDGDARLTQGWERLGKAKISNVGREVRTVTRSSNKVKNKVKTPAIKVNQS